MQKYKNEAGQIAVLYSPGFGSGWSTWAAVTDNACIFDPETVQWVLDGKDPRTQPDFVKKFKAVKPENQHITFYASAAYDLEVEWVDPGTKFRIAEYDGSESVEYLDDMEFITA